MPVSSSGVPRASAVSVLALNAYLLIAAGSSVGVDQVRMLGLPVTVAGFALALAAVVQLARPNDGDTRSLGSSCLWLAAMTTVGIMVPPRDHPPLWYAIFYRAVPVTGVLLAGVAGSGRARATRTCVWIAIVMVVGLQVITPWAVPRPNIDVWSWTQVSVQALIHGIHPYTVRADDIYGGVYAMGYTNTVYPYMPLTLLVHAPFVKLFGDFRYGLALCLPATIWLMRAAARRLAVDAYLLDVVTLALVLHPRGAYLVSSGYNEPLLMLAAAAFVYLAVRWPRGAGQGVAFFCLPALKQYFAAPAIMFAADLVRRRLYRPLILGAVVAAATVMPFLLTHASATFDGIVFQLRPEVAFRPDSISVVALAASVFGLVPWHWLPEVVQLAAGAIVFWRLRDLGLAGLLLSAAVAMCASFLAGTQAFLNYYFFIGVLLLLTAITAPRAGEGRTV